MLNIPFTQTKEYLSWHNALGEQTLYKEFWTESTPPDFQIDDEKEKELLATAAIVLIKLSIGMIMYIPYGPVFYKKPNKAEVNNIYKELKEIGKAKGVIFVRLEDSQNYLESFYAPPIKTYAKEAVYQPRMEWCLDLTKSEENILNEMHKDHKYMIRRAERENVEIEIITENISLYFEEFIILLNETSKRDGFILQDEKYYKAIFEAEENGELKKYLVFSKLDDRYTSCALVIEKDHIANLVFAGSLSYKREVGYNNLMQWEAIKFAKQNGCLIYNFGGIIEGSYGKKTLRGVTFFKKRFGGFLKFNGFFRDIPIKKFLYFIYLLRKMIQ